MREQVRSGQTVTLALVVSGAGMLTLRQGSVVYLPQSVLLPLSHTASSESEVMCTIPPLSELSIMQSRQVKTSDTLRCDTMVLSPDAPHYNSLAETIVIRSY